MFCRFQVPKKRYLWSLSKNRATPPPPPATQLVVSREAPPSWDDGGRSCLDLTSVFPGLFVSIRVSSFRAGSQVTRSGATPPGELAASCTVGQQVDWAFDGKQHYAGRAIWRIGLSVPGRWDGRGSLSETRRAIELWVFNYRYQLCYRHSIKSRYGCKSAPSSQLPASAHEKLFSLAATVCSVSVDSGTMRVPLELQKICCVAEVAQHLLAWQIQTWLDVDSMQSQP
ncbi:hypothetical protein QBC40DRAFT_351867 [Triangularia verruculosa]|uniref:Uncharacterized protein n=1 Tax=Triangularia verruculosa TaxID=2587418 RepID=A0AAN6X912_9PEZI|nr:hypothetical protein QBC40DRAFT_351867 [Triangularia verruculosa]